MTALNTENLLTVLEHLVHRGAWRTAADRIGVTETTLFRWLQRSRREQHDKITTTPLYLEWQDSFDFFHCHADRARAHGRARRLDTVPAAVTRAVSGTDAE